jgi:hypothetical protein
MSSTDILYDKSASQGMLTKVWGPHLWIALHTITFGYPIEPNEEQKKNYKAYFQSLGYVLPCKFCRDSYQEYIKTSPTEITDEVFKNRANLTKWLYDLHERVNKKLGITYGVTFDDIVKKYESYRAKCDPKQEGCVMPLDLKANAFKLDKLKDCPIINLELAMLFKDYANKRGVFEYKELESCSKYKNTRDSKEWKERNIKCNELIQHMRENGLPSLEKEGEYKDLPTIHELKLMARLCSNLKSEELIKIASRFQLGGNINIKYKFKTLSF